MATTIQLIKREVHGSPLWVSHKSIPSKILFKGTMAPKIWYYIDRKKDVLEFKGTYIPMATYDTVKHQIFNNIPIKGIEKKLVASRVNMNLTMGEIKEFIKELRTISNRKEE